MDITEELFNIASSLFRCDSPELRTALRELCLKEGENLVARFAATLVDKPSNVNLINGDQVTFGLGENMFASYRYLSKTSDFLYLGSHQSLEIVLRLPPGGAVLNSFEDRLASSRTFFLHDDFSQHRLRLLMSEPAYVGQLVFKNHPHELYDWVCQGRLFTIKIVRLSTAPYELIFKRESCEYAGVLQSNFRPGLLRTAVELIAATDPQGAEDDLVALAGDLDPMVAWEAVRVLEAMGSSQIPAILADLAGGDIPLLAIAAKRALGGAA